MESSLIVAYMAVTLTASALVFAGGTALSSFRWRTRLSIAIPVLAGYGAVCALQPASWLLSDIALLAGAIAGGSLIGTAIGSFPGLVTFLLTAAVVDVLSFSGGLTQRIVADYRTGGSDLLLYLAVSIPIRGSIRPMIGVGDMMVLGAIFSAMLRLGCPRWHTLVVPTAGLVAAVLVALAVGGVFGLPFIGGTTLLYLYLWRRDSVEGLRVR